MPQMLSALCLFSCQDNETLHGITSTKKFPKDSEIYFQPLDNNVTVKGLRKEQKKKSFYLLYSYFKKFKGLGFFMDWETW